MEEWNDTGIVGWDRTSGIVKGEWDGEGRVGWDRGSGMVKG